MSKRVSATDAKNNFGGLLEDVASLGRVEVVRHGRVVAIVLSPAEWRSVAGGAAAKALSPPENWRRNHMIPAPLARAARRVGPPVKTSMTTDVEVEAVLSPEDLRFDSAECVRRREFWSAGRHWRFGRITTM